MEEPPRIPEAMRPAFSRPRTTRIAAPPSSAQPDPPAVELYRAKRECPRVAVPAALGVPAPQERPHPSRLAAGGGSDLRLEQLQSAPKRAPAPADYAARARIQSLHASQEFTDQMVHETMGNITRTAAATALLASNGELGLQRSRGWSAAHSRLPVAPLRQSRDVEEYRALMGTDGLMAAP